MHTTHTRIPFGILSKWYLKRIGHAIEFPNFLSSSKLSRPYGETLYQIRIIKKSNSHYIHLILNKPTEQEVLFKSHSVFRIQRVDIKSSTVYLDEINGADVKIVLKDDVFRSDDEIGLEVRESLGPIQLPDNIQPSLND